ncbi:MAG: HAE1 family hydrophobic/amphiphilic exporter-1 [Candidatus Paceibacteria bacterium]|jgi:HAE1 family hydrophobic/amphiphilic exporter-1
MNVVPSAIRQPVTVAVGVILILLAGVVALRRIPIQLTPNVEDTVIAVTTRWDGASPEEIEQEIIDLQEEKLQGIANVQQMTSTSLQGSGTIKLKFSVGTSKELALREVSDKLRQVPTYPDNVDEPVVEASDPENRDYIAWIIFETSDQNLDIRTLQDFAEDRIKPIFERVDGIAAINVLGGRARETHVKVDPALLAQHDVGISQLVAALRQNNRTMSAGLVSENKYDVRLRMVNQFTSVEQVEETVIAQAESGPVYVKDVAVVLEAFKEAGSFVRSKGRAVIAINAQKEVGVNVIEVMDGLKLAMAGMNEEGGLLDSQALNLGLDGTLSLSQAYDQTVYIDDALLLVKDNIWLGGGLAILVLMLFLRSIRSSGIIALAIPISIIGAVAAMITIGRTVNVISLAGMAFAIGMVVDNAIVVLENIYRHLEKGKPPFQAALDGTREVLGAVVAATLTTIVVFIPILLIQDEAGQLFRDIALAIVTAVFLSLVVSVTVIPTCAARLLSLGKNAQGQAKKRWRMPFFGSIPDWIGNFTYWVGGSVFARLVIVIALTTASVVGSMKLMPPADYLPTGNRNLVFGLLIPPPGYNLDKSSALAERLEETVQPFWLAGEQEFGSPAYEQAKSELPAIPTFDYSKGKPGEPVVPPPLSNYFIVSFPGTMFHGGISTEGKRVTDHLALFGHATRADQAPGVLAFAFQVPLFRLGGATGSAVNINLSGDDLEEVSAAASAVFLDMMNLYGPRAVQPNPSNFNLPGPELQVIPNLRRLSEVGLYPQDLGLAIQVLGDGAIIGDYRVGGKNIDLRVMSKESRSRSSMATIGETPLATPFGGVVPIESLGRLQRVNSAPQINRLGRRRCVSLQFTPPPDLSLEEAIDAVELLLAKHRADGSIPVTVATSYTGSASKLASVQEAMFGDGTLVGTLSSAMALALLVVYLLMCVLFQSFLRPLIIMFSVPLATLGGFAALYGVHLWSLEDPYMPLQSLDILTLLGFVILIGVVVNNAILIVHQTQNFITGGDGPPMEARRAIAEAVRSRVRPIFMGTMTSVGGMAPLVFMPGSGSELYRGLGSVVVGGLILSTIFTLFLVPALLSLLTQLQGRLGTIRKSGTLALGVESARALGGLLLLSSLFHGCASPESNTSPRMHALMQEVVQRELRQLDRTGSAPAKSVDSGEELRAALGDRLPEIEEQGGPQSYADLDLVTPPSLDGLAHGPRPIDLVWAVTRASENNLSIRLSREQVGMDREESEAADADFDTTLFADVQLDRRDEPNVVPTLGGIPLGARRSRSDVGTFSVGGRQLLEAGGWVEASTSLLWTDNRTQGIDLNPDPGFRSGVALSISQPLLRGSGQDITRYNQTLLEHQLERSEQDLSQQLALVMEAAELAYWDLQEAWKTLGIQQQLTERGEEVERVLRERRAFDASPAEYSDSLATLQNRRANIVRAGRLVALASDRLKQVVNDPQVPLLSEELLRPSEDLGAPEYAESLERLILLALSQRPEVERAVLGIEDADLQRRVAENLQDPTLDLRAGGVVSGLDDGAGDAYSNLVTDDHYSLFLGLSFELPVGNRAAAARERQALHQNRAAILAYEQVVRAVLLEVKTALRNVRTNATLVEASKNVRLAQTENLRALSAEREQRSELSPEFLNLLFQRQERLALAQLAEVRALADYNRSLATLHRVLGSGMRSERIELRTP